ncbi:efflux transporter outer membrane subunit [Phenylobacterium sp.]|uniref:efflux transporter outer membrane subunit n=1 Tax=Phenylobacterium sp. TaxID=1871053 RepID=UPI0035AF3447
MPSNKLIRRALAGAAAAALLAGCAAVGPDYARPDAPKAQTYAMAGETAPAEIRLADAGPGPWWNALGSPALDAVIRQALADSPTLAEADATLAQSRAALAQARGAALPQADANAGVERERVNLQAFGFTGFGDVTLSNPTFSLYSVGGGVGYDLDLFGGQRRRIEGAAARVEAQARRADAAYLTLTANVALQAVTIATLNAQIAETQAMIAADEDSLAMVRRAAELGGSASTDRIAAAAQLEDDRTLLPPLKAELAAARHALAELVGRAPADWTPPDFALDGFKLAGPAPVSLPSSLVRRRPDILAAEADLHAATADIGVATADLYPDIRLSASITQGALKPGELFTYDASGWDLGGGLTAPLFHGGELRARRQGAVDAAKAANARYQQTVLKAFVEVADALQALTADDESLAAHDRAQAHADERVRLAKAGYGIGGVAMLDVLDAQRRAHDLRAKAVRAQGQRLADVVRLIAASGADWRTAPAAAD